MRISDWSSDVCSSDPPILAGKVSGEGGRATLASILPEELRAVSIPVNQVTGVAGFVRAGDVVDVMLTRQIPGEGAQRDDKMTTVVLENVYVLAIDQIANENETEPTVGQTATRSAEHTSELKTLMRTSNTIF